MKDILAESNKGVLADAVGDGTLLAFDYDGTLAPIVGDPDKAAMRAATRELLTELARVLPCAVISGRAQDDVSRRLRGVDVIGVMGNHGLEPWRRTEMYAARVQRWLSVLAGLDEVEGLRIEDKTFSLAIHYRHCLDKIAALARVVELVDRLEGARLISGKDVVNLVPAGAPHKGAGLELLRSRLGCVRAIYVGDDVTDEDAFALEESGRVFGIRVEMSETSRASYFIEDQRRVDDLLRLLLSMHPGRAELVGKGK